MFTTIRRLHRILVDRLTETSWLKDRAGANASWAHYERHARVRRRTQERHAGARQRAQERHAGARQRAQERHARGRDRAAAGHARHDRPPRVAATYQAAIGRIVRRRPAGRAR